MLLGGFECEKLMRQNVLGVKWYGEGEFYLSIFKVLLILGLSLFTCEYDQSSSKFRRNHG